MDIKIIKSKIIDSVIKGIDYCERVKLNGFNCYKLILNCADLVDVESKLRIDKRLSTHFDYANSQTGGLQLKY